MKTTAVSLLFAGILCCTVPTGAQQTSAQGMPASASCGADQPDFSIKKDVSASAVTQPPEGKALVYVVEEMPSTFFLSTTVALGVDGSWIGATKQHSYMSFTLDPGVHPLCAQYQGGAAVGEPVLRRLNVQGGRVYYLLYRGIFTRSSGEVAFLNEVDEDEGSYLLRSSDRVISTLRK
jgi:hypothetical protein